MILTLLLAISGYMLPASNINNGNKKQIIFFTGGNSLMPPDIYSDFINKLRQEYKVNTIKNSNKESISVLKQIYEYSMNSNNNRNNDLIVLGHSSGCTTLLNYCCRIPNVKKCILLDPVNNNVDKNVIVNFDSVLQINAEKAYKWEFTFPIPRVPFIPAFKMDPKLLKNVNNYTNVEIANYGHCDILDTAFSNFMHNTVAKGTEDRNSINEYKDFIIHLINCYVNDISLNNDNFESFKIN